MNKEQIIHDLTVSLASKSSDAPEAIVKAYYDLLPQVKENVNETLKQSCKPAKIYSKSETNIY